MEHKFEWNKEKKELVETRIGDELVDAKQNKVEGKFINTTIYPEHTARNMIAELTKQIKDMDLQGSVIEKSIKNFKKSIKPVDKVFWTKFQACASMMGIKQKEDELNNNKEAKDGVLEQLDEVRKAMGDEF